PVTGPTRSGAGPLTVERYARVVSLGSALPERVVPNAYFESLDIGTNDQWIFERTGIRERRFAGPGETTSSLAAAAGRSCLDAAGVGPPFVAPPPLGPRSPP